MDEKHSTSEINKLATDFFNAFSNINGQPVQLKSLKTLLIPEGIIIKNTLEQTETYTLDTFIAPREKMLNDGTLRNFEEKELWSRTDIFGKIAQRFSTYVKSGLLNGNAFSTKGMKSMQFIHIENQWKICAIIWDDEHAHSPIPEKYL